jgi:hypothetical protein
VIDPARAFALVSVLFYARLRGRRLPPGRGDGPRARTAARVAAGLAAGLYAAFSPAFVTRYSLSNDGNYVEVLALGTWALVLALRWADEPARRPRWALAIGLLLGLAFWCHILAVIPAAAVAVFLLLESPRGAAAAPRDRPRLRAGRSPSASSGTRRTGGSRSPISPRGRRIDRRPPSGTSAGKAWSLLSDQLPVLLGYDFGYPAADRFAREAMALRRARPPWPRHRPGRTRRARRGGRPWRLILVFTAVNLGIAWLALPYIPGNPRYLLLFLMAAVPCSSRSAERTDRSRRARGPIATGALASLAQAAWA